MSNSYKANVNGTHSFEFTEEQLADLDAIPLSDHSYHLLFQNRSIAAEITESNFLKKSYEVKVENNLYTVQLEDEVDQLIKEMGFELGASKQINNLKAPMPGLILSIDVEDGSEVKEGDTLLILSAMKMENSFLSPRDGVIKQVHVEVNQAIDKGQLLIEFES